MPEWVYGVCIIWAFAWGFMCAWAFNNQHVPFWRGFADGITLRFLWRR